MDWKEIKAIVYPPTEHTYLEDKGPYYSNRAQVRSHGVTPKRLFRNKKVRAYHPPKDPQGADDV